MKREIFNRRMTMLRAVSRRIRPSVFIPQVAREYNDSEAAVRGDWTRRKQWMPKILRLADPSLLCEFVEGLNELLREVWRVITDTHVQDSVRLGAIRTAGDIYLHYVDLLQSLGYAYNTPEKIETKISEPIIVRMWLPREQEEDRDREEKPEPSRLEKLR